MIYFRKPQLCIVALFSLAVSAQKVVKIKPKSFVAIAIPEPSDICFSAISSTFFVVSDNGVLFEINHDGTIIRKVEEIDSDFEAVHSDENNVYAVNERHRKICVYDKNSLRKTKTITVPFGGGRNRGYEAITFNNAKNVFVLVVEKDPITLFELDADFKIINEINLSKIARDIAAATFYDNHLWLLSDEDRSIFKLNPTTYEVIGQWLLPVINPEGLAFDKEGNLLVTCDDMQRLYYFNNPEKR